MFTTDGAVPSLLRRARRDRRRAADRVRARRGPDARAADGDDRPGDVPRPRRGAGRDRARARARRSTCCRRSGSGGRSACSSTGEVVARDGRLIVPTAGRSTGPPGPGSSRRDAEAFAPLTGDAARRALRERRDQPARRPRGRAGRRPGRARRPRRLVGHEGRRRELPATSTGFATTATTSLELLVLGTRPGRDGPRGGAGRRDGRRLRVRRRLVGAAGDRRADRGRRLRHERCDRARAD